MRPSLRVNVVAALALLSSFTAAAQAVVYSVSNHQAVGATLNLSAANTYTHKLDFPGDGATTAINGVTFNTAPAGNFANYSLTMPNLSTFNSGSSSMLADFHYIGSGAVGSVETLTLKGLTPGQTYDMRLYYRNFGSRPNNVVINTGSAPVALVLDQATASNENYHSILYKAEATEATVTFAQQVFNASWHQYGVTNQVAESGKTVLLGGLFPTGVDANGAVLANGAGDVHYAFVGGPQASAAGAQATVQANHPAWSANNGQSKWISVTDNGANNILPGQYSYAINFEVPVGADPATAVIQGSWFADNDGAGTTILLNGIDTLVSSSAPFNAALPGTAFTITDGMGGASFLSGTNTLTFVVNNGGTSPNPGGLRVHTLFGTAQIIPEPATATLGLLALGGLMLRRRRTA